MARFIIAGISGGILFGIMDGLINANPLAQKLYSAFKPISRASINMSAGMIIDLFYGFVMAAIFLWLHSALPGDSGILKGISFGLMAWFFRVVMAAVSQWMMFEVPANTLIYTMGAGLIEMLVIGVFYGMTLRPIN